MRVLNRSADRFEQALEGLPVSHEPTTALVGTARRVAAVGHGMPGPDPAFVATLRDRLLVEAASMPARTPAQQRRADDGRDAERTAPVVVVVGRGLPRALAGAVASLLLIAAIVGAASRGALPGDVLYPVKGWLDNAAVRLADNDFDRGQVYLSQAQEHISDARDLADTTDPQAGDITVALQAAMDSVRGGQRALDAAWARTGNPQALLAMRDFAARALPQVEALRGQVPAASLPALGELEALLQESQDTTARRIAACGASCSGLTASPLGTSSTPGATTTAAPGSPGSAGAAGGAGGPAPAPTGTSGAGPKGPAVSAGGGGLGVGASGGGARLSTGGASIGGPTISATAPLPSATATVPLPSASLSSSGVGANLPGATLGPVTLPGATLTLP
jgi:hypothetical protein